MFRASGTGTYVCCILCKNHTGTRNLSMNSFGTRPSILSDRITSDIRMYPSMYTTIIKTAENFTIKKNNRNGVMRYIYFCEHTIIIVPIYIYSAYTRLRKAIIKLSKIYCVEVVLREETRWGCKKLL